MSVIENCLNLQFSGGAKSTEHWVFSSGGSSSVPEQATETVSSKILLLQVIMARQCAACAYTCVTSLFYHRS